MAYDKVVDSAQLESAIKASADAIREKTGDSALIQWLSDKGFADAIAAIESGGGGIVGFDEIYSGTFVVESALTGVLYVPIGISVPGDVTCILYPLDNPDGGKLGRLCYAMYSRENVLDKILNIAFYTNTSSGTVSRITSGNTVSHSNADFVISDEIWQYIAPGVTYAWAILKMGLTA